MDSLSVAVSAIPSDRADVVAGSDVVMFFVNGQDLMELVARADRNTRSSSGRFGPVRASQVLPPSLHLLGYPSPQLQDNGWAVVLDCGCGAWECGGLLARVDVRDDVVTWSDFQTPYSLTWLGEHPGEALPDELSLDRLGPFRFERAAYEAVLRRPERIAWPYPVPDEGSPTSAGPTT